MKYHLNFQNPNNYPNLPNIFHIQRWVNTALTDLIDTGELTLRIVNTSTIQSLNNQYRHINKPTNVLSFPSEVPSHIMKTLPERPLGDIIICHEIIEKEAFEQHKTLEAHYAHMIIHGLLHLLGYDHIKESEAEIMEPLEIKTLALLGFNDPYAPIEDAR